MKYKKPQHCHETTKMKELIWAADENQEPLRACMPCITLRSASLFITSHLPPEGHAISCLLSAPPSGGPEPTAAGGGMPPARYCASKACCCCFCPGSFCKIQIETRGMDMSHAFPCPPALYLPCRPELQGLPCCKQFWRWRERTVGSLWSLWSIFIQFSHIPYAAQCPAFLALWWKLTM